MSRQNKPWWQSPTAELADALSTRMKFLERASYESRADNLLYINIASNFNPSGSGAYGSLNPLSATKNKIRRNICAAGVNLASSLCTASRTLPSYQTSGADWRTRRVAEERARVIHAQMIQLGAFSLGDQAFVDSAHVGMGITVGIIDPETGLPKLVRALPNSIFVDSAEGRDPRSLYWVHFLPREALLEYYPNKKLEDSLGPSSQDFETFILSRDDKTADLVKLTEAWHLPVGNTSGRHVITSSNCVIVDEPWDLPRFPVAVMRYEDRIVGWGGQGLVERLLPAQLRISELQRIVDRSQDLGSRPVFLVEQNSGVAPDEITNMPGQVYTYQGTPPQMQVWSGTPVDLVNEINLTWQSALEQEGLNPAMAAGGLPQKSLNSGRAVRAADDVVTRSKLTCIRRLEQYYLQVAQLITDLNDLVLSADPTYQVTGYSVAGKNQFLKSSKWADLSLEPGDARLTVLPMSALPSTLQARLATITEMISQGYVSRAQAVALQEMPDYESWTDSESAQIDLILWQIDRIIDGDVELPLPRQDHKLALKEATNSYLIQYRSGAPQDVLDRLEQYMRACEDGLNQQPEPTETGTDPAALNQEALNAAQINQQG